MVIAHFLYSGTHCKSSDTFRQGTLAEAEYSFDRTILSWNVIYLIWSILGIELTIHWNAIRDLNDTTSTGEMVFMVIGITNLIRVCYLLSKLVREVRLPRLSVAQSCSPLLVTANRLLPAGSSGSHYSPRARKPSQIPPSYRIQGSRACRRAMDQTSSIRPC
jgi:hypothetical protein